MGKTWTQEDENEAINEGWNLYAVDGNPNRLEIQRVDELEIFESDDEAIAFVKDWANIPVEDSHRFSTVIQNTCKLALSLIELQDNNKIGI